MSNDVSALMSVVGDIAANAGFDDANSLLSRIAREQAYGSRGSIFSDIFYGLNRRQQGNAVPNNSDIQGLTFFTRPNLNLSYDNVAQVRSLTPLLSREVNTYQRAIRTILDPVGEAGDRWSRDVPGRGVVSPNLVDSLSPFIPVLSNSLISCSGWPDINLSVYNTPEGVSKESWMMIDGKAEINGRFDLSCTFQNMLGDPITLLFFAWMTYMSAVYTNRMTPYPHILIENEIDYMTRVYRFVLDYSGRFIQKWAATGASIPYSLTIGAAFNFSRDTPYSEENNQIGIPMACVGAMYNDPIVLEEFNLLQLMFNPDMADDRRSQKYQKLAPSERALFNYNGYPRVNLKTNELEWWVDKEVYNASLKGSLK